MRALPAFFAIVLWFLSACLISRLKWVSKQQTPLGMLSETTGIVKTRPMARNLIYSGVTYTRCDINRLATNLDSRECCISLYRHSVQGTHCHKQTRWTEVNQYTCARALGHRNRRSCYIDPSPPNCSILKKLQWNKRNGKLILAPEKQK